jgi:hypothetical protein
MQLVTFDNYLGNDEDLASMNLHMIYIDHKLAILGLILNIYFKTAQT